MDGVGASGLYSVVVGNRSREGYVATSRRVVAVSTEVQGVGSGGVVAGVDFGGSSKYLNENFEGRSGEGFYVNSS